MNKKTRSKFGILIAIALIVSIVLYVNYSGDDDSSSLSVLPLSASLGEEPVLLDFCTSEQGCINYYKENGMPEGFLDQKGYKILCYNGNCYIQKK